MSEHDRQAELSDWSGALAARRQMPEPVAEDWSRRTLTLVVIAVALIWPVYNHVVEGWIARIELNQALREAERQIAQLQQETAVARGERAVQLRNEAAQAAARDLRTRVAAVRVVGAIDGPTPVVIVERLPAEGAAEAAEFICAQASGWLRRNIKGITLMVQRDRGSRPATDAGRVNCP